MTEYGDEKFIYQMALNKAQDQNDKAVNDIKNGYAIIEDNKILFSERSIIDGKLFMTLPSEFELMPLEIAKFKYPNENRPDVTFMNEQGSTTVNFTVRKDKLKPDDIEDAKDFMQQMITKMNPSLKIISSAVIGDDLRIGYFDFVSPAIDTEIYNLMFLFSMDGKFTMGTFNCMHLDMAGWLDVAYQMLHSIRVVEGNR